MVKSFNGVLSKENVSLKKFNTFRVNAKALEFYMPETINGFIDLIKYLNDNNKRYMILGGGSNVLFLDKVIEFPIIYMGFFSRIEHTSHNILAYSGAKVSDVVKEGQQIPVKLLEIDKMGRLNLSYIDAIEDQQKK